MRRQDGGVRMIPSSRNTAKEVCLLGDDGLLAAHPAVLALSTSGLTSVGAMLDRACGEYLAIGWHVGCSFASAGYHLGLSTERRASVEFRTYTDRSRLLFVILDVPVTPLPPSLVEVSHSIKGLDQQTPA